MAYQRKTEDSYQILVNYGQGWEHECTERTRKEAREQKQTYQANCPEYPVKIRYKREPVGFWAGGGMRNL